MIDAAGREILEIVARLQSEGESTMKANIQSHVKGFRGQSNYFQTRIRKLVEAGYLERTTKGYKIKEIPPIEVEEIVRVSDQRLTTAAETSDLIFTICGIAQDRPNDVPDLAREVRSLISFEQVEFKFLQLNVLYRLLENPNLIPHINLPRKESEWEDVVKEIKELF